MNDLISVIKEEHQTIKELFAQLERDPGIADNLMRALVAHEVAEETVPFPVARKLPGGQAMVEARIDEQSAAEAQLDQIEAIADPTARAKALRELKDTILAHANNEEATVYKLMAEECSADELLKLGERFMKIKAMAPTHPHPDAPDTPPGNVVMGPVAGLADRLRDAAKKV